MLTFRTLSGGDVDRYLAPLAKLRMQVFREFPYLYDGDKAYEKRYLQTYIEAPDSIIVLALDGEEIVGASTGLPLEHETAEVKQPFIDAGYSLPEVFYCGESVLLPQYRGQGAGVAFFDFRETHARQLPGIRFSTFCAVQRPLTHPSRPADYQLLDTFWQKRGYRYQANMTTCFSWKELGETQESDKPMAFWIKEL